MSNSNSSSIWTVSFWKATAERVILTFIQSYFGIIIAIGAAASLDLTGFDWLAALWPALTAALLCLVKCLIAGLVGNAGPSLANETLTDYPRIGRTS